MKKIGIVTLWSDNYGSVLQSYSMIHVLRNMGYWPEILYQNEKGVYRIAHWTLTLKNMAKNTIRHPSYLKTYLKLKKSSVASKNHLSPKSATCLKAFVRINLNPVGVCYKEISEEAVEKKYKAFIAGSDQIWNGYIPYNPFSFLQFAPSNKRIAYAPSFGTSSVPNYNRKKFAKAISSFGFLSSREKDGVSIIRELTGRTVPQMPDPTVLLTNEEWNMFYSERISDEPYIFTHFLNEPNEIAIKALSEYRNIKNARVICFSYPHDSLIQIGAELYEGSPEEYLSGIVNASVVFTDSFHTTLFALRYDKQFYVFKRQYDHGFSQESRITSLLQQCDYSDRLIDRFLNLESLPISLHSCAQIFEKDRKHAFAYLYKALKEEVEEKKVPLLKSDDECTGCGVCELICPKHAINMVNNDKRFLIPRINHNLCIKCGMCEKYCHLSVKRPPRVSKAFIAFNRNNEIRAKSASGGVFAALAMTMIKKGGVVFGATMNLGNDIIVQHRGVDAYRDLYSLLGSKYVQSDCRKAYPQIKRLLEDGKEVLFGGTSCQVEALHRYLNKPYSSLYTVDLICHGVPGGGLFEDYICYLSKKYCSKVTEFSFRKKINGDIEYTEVIHFENGQVMCIPWKRSLFYQQFLRCESYRDSCYECKFASLDKPSNITIGDYFEARRDYKELFQNNSTLANVRDVSCMIINDKSGLKLVELLGCDLELFEVDSKRVQLSHNQLCAPSRHSQFRNKLFRMYEKNGFNELEKYYTIRDTILWFPRKIYNVVNSK